MWSPCRDDDGLRMAADGVHRAGDGRDERVVPYAGPLVGGVVSVFVGIVTPIGA